jgi:hypothetical protein
MPLALIRRLIKGTPLTAAEHDGNLNVLEAAIAASLQPGQAIPSDVECRNNSGVGLTAGAPVYIVSSSGTKPTVALADASSEATAARSLGLVVATVNNNADCMVRTHGVLTGVNTATLTEGAAVWLSETTGQLTSTRPTQPAHGVFFGFCVKQAAGTAGILYVNVINGQELDELHDVLITGAPPAAEAPRPALVRGPDGLWRDLLLTPGDVGAAPAAQGVTNGNSHNHDGGDGAQIAYSSLSGTPTLGGAAALNVGTSAGTVAAGDAPAAAITALKAEANPLPQYLQPAEIIAGTNMSVDTTTTPGSVILSTTGSGATPAGTATEIQYRNAGALGAIPNSAVDGTTGAVTLARLLLTANGAASTSPLALTGTWFTGGTTTTTKPQVLIEPTGTVSTSWSTAGTGLGVNAPSGFTGNLLDLQIGGASQVSFKNQGNLSGFRFGSEDVQISKHVVFGYFDFKTTSANFGFIFSAPTFVFGIRSQGVALENSAYLGWGDSNQNNGHSLLLFRDAANILAQRNGTAAQTTRIYNTFTSTTNFERAKIEWASNILRIGTEKGSGGGTARDMELQTDGTTRITLKANGAIIFTGLPTTDPAVTGQLWNDGGTLKISA